MSNNIDEETQSSTETGEDKTSENGKETTPEEGKRGDEELDPKTLLAQKLHYKGKSEKAEAKIAELEAKIKELAANHDPVKDANEQKQEPKDSTMWREQVDFLLDHRDYTKDEVEFLASVAQGTGKSLRSLAEDKDIKEFLALRRKRVEEEQKSLHPSSRTSDTSLHEEISKIPEKDMAKRYPELLQQILARKKSKTTV